MAQINISSFNVRCFFSKGAFSAICLIIPSQFFQIFLLITMDNFHFCSFLPALCRTQSTAINGAGTTSSYGLFRPVTTNGRKVRVGRSNPARQKAGYVYFIESLLPASWLGLLFRSVPVIPLHRVPPLNPFIYCHRLWARFFLAKRQAGQNRFSLRS